MPDEMKQHTERRRSKNIFWGTVDDEDYKDIGPLACDACGDPIVVATMHIMLLTVNCGAVYICPACIRHTARLLEETENKAQP